MGGEQALVWHVWQQPAEMDTLVEAMADRLDQVGEGALGVLLPPWGAGGVGGAGRDYVVARWCGCSLRLCRNRLKDCPEGMVQSEGGKEQAERTWE
jgi:hypothetical protein